MRTVRNKQLSFFFIILIFLSIRLHAQVGTVVGWGMSICNTFSFNICPNQTITPFNYGAQTWACNNLNAPDISFNINGPAWRVARNNYSFTANVNGQISGFSPGGGAQSMPIPAGQTLTPLAYMVVSGVNSVVFSINGSPTTYTFNQNSYSISIVPVVFTGNSYTLCINNATSIAVSLTPPPQGGPWTYNWQPGNFSGNPVVVSPNVSTIYTVTATAGLSCTNTATVAVTVTNCCVQPTITATASPTAICAGQSTTLSASGAGVGGTYTWSPGNLIGQNVVVSPTVTTIYTVAGTNSVSCSSTKTIQIVVNPLPVVTPSVNSPVCVGGNINLSVGPATTYTWSGSGNYSSFQQNPIITNAQVSNSGIYTVAVTNANGCTNSATVSVIVNAPPVVNASNGGPYCPGSAINLSVTAGVSYIWSGPGAYSSGVQNPVIANAQPSNAGVYNVTVTAANGCHGISSTNVNINPAPVPVAGCNGPVCLGQTANFTGLGGVTYTWTGPNGFVSNLQNPVISQVQAIQAGTYSLSVTNNQGCTASASIALNIISSPVIITGNQITCIGQNINLTANGASTYTWSGPGGFTSAFQNPVISNAQPSMAGVYTVVGTSTSGCIASAIANVSIIAVPAPFITSNSPLCEGGLLSLSCTGGGSFNWTGPNGFSSAVQTPSITNVQAAAQGIYTVVNTVGSCSVSITGSVTINAAPSFTALNNSPVCPLTSVIFSVTGGNTYQWLGPNNYSASGNNPVISNAGSQSAGIYTVVGTATNGCIKSETVAVSLYPLPVIAASGCSVCINQIIYISATGGASYTWTGPGGFTANQQAVNIVNATTQQAGSYTAQATDNNGCTGQGLAVVVVHNLPDITASSDPAVCVGGNFSLHAQSIAGDGFQWSGPNGFTSMVKDPQLQNINANNAGTYTVIVSDDIGCINSAVVNIVVHDLPHASISADKISGCVPLCIDLGTKSNTSLQSCEWNFGDNTGMTGLDADKCFTNAGTYMINAKYTDGNGCANSSSLSVEVWPVPQADFNYAPGKPMVGEPVIFTNASLGGAVITDYVWSFSNLANNTFTTETSSCTYENAGQYAAALIVVSDHGCRDTIVKAIVIEEDFELYVPNAFTPNGDGTNDTFSPKGFGIVKYEITIFDRWGEQIFYSRDFSVPWDGKFKGIPVVKEDAYVWKIYATDIDGKTHELCGTVTLLK